MEYTEILGRWLTPSDMAKPQPIGFEISESTQAKMRMQGRIPYSKIGNKYIRYDRRELDKWLENNSVVSI